MASGFERIFEVGPGVPGRKVLHNKHTTSSPGFDLEFSYIDSYRT